MRTLALRRETLTPLNDTELAELHGAASVTTITGLGCITMPGTYICVSVRNCVTDNCTETLRCPA